MLKKTLLAAAAALFIGTGAAVVQPAPAQASGFSLHFGNSAFGWSVHDRGHSYWRGHRWRHHRKFRRFHGRRHCFIRHRPVKIREWNRWRHRWEWKKVWRPVRICR